MDLPKFHPNERVDLGDVEFLSSGQLGEFQRLFTSLIAGEATKRIIDGFTFTVQSATVLQIALGKAVLVENRNAALRYGQLTGGGSPTEGPTAQNVSFSGLPVTTHGVYVRFVYGDGTVANRAFWDTVANVEQIQAVSTRKVAGWQVMVAQNNPGDEWYKVVDVEWNGTNLATSTLTDRRAFLFEGPADSTPQTFRPSWGGGSDRNADRATHGVKTLERFASAVLKKIEEIQSDTPATRWWTAPVEPLDKKVSRFGDATMAGNYLPDASGRDLGASGFRWDAFLADVDVQNVTLTNTLVLTTGRVGSSFIPNFDDGFSLGDASFKWSDVYTNFLHAGQIRRQPAITTADVGTSAARFRKLWFESGDFSAGLTAFGPISFGSALTTDGNILTSGATRDLGAVTSAGTRWNVFANTLDVLSTSTFTGAATFTSQPRVPKPSPVAKLTATSVANSVQQQSVAAAWCRISKPAATAYVSAHTLRVHNIVLNPTVIGGGTVLQFDFVHPMANTDYVVLISAGSTGNAPCTGRVTARTTTDFTIVVDDWNGTIFQNIDFTQVGGSPQLDLNVVVFGDAA